MQASKIHAKICKVAIAQYLLPLATTMVAYFKELLRKIRDMEIRLYSQSAIGLSDHLVSRPQALFHYKNSSSMSGRSRTGTDREGWICDYIYAYK